MRASVGAVLGGWLKPSLVGPHALAALAAAPDGELDMGGELERHRNRLSWRKTAPLRHAAHQPCSSVCPPAPYSNVNRYIYEGNVVDVTSYMAEDLHPGEPSLLSLYIELLPLLLPSCCHVAAHGCRPAPR